MSQKTEDKYKYRFSFVMPIYNVEPYLAEALDSILNQTMKFEDDCEIILVNDGSTDNSEEVCLSYVNRFPDRITYIKQKNSGPGAARNAGLVRAQGKYVSMLDSDDILSPDTLREVYNFFESHYDEVDVVTIKWEFFEARSGEHPLNYKFYDGDRVIDLDKECSSILPSAATAFFKRSVFERHSFDPSVGRYSEDAKLMGEILLDKRAFGVVAKPVYYYRKRNSQTSSQDGNLTDKFWYLETPVRAWKKLFEHAQRENHGVIPKFIQFMVMYDLQWRFSQQQQTVLSGREVQKYKKYLLELLQNIDDDIILDQRNIFSEHKMYVLSKKHDTDIVQAAKKKDDGWYYGDTKIFDHEQPQSVVIDLLEVGDDDTVSIEGSVRSILFQGGTFGFKVGGKFYPAKKTERPHRKVYFLGEQVFDGNCFSIKFNVNHGDNVSPMIKFDDGSIKRLPIAVTGNSRLNQFSAGRSYRRTTKYLICHANPSLLVFARKTAFRHFIKEVRYALSLIDLRNIKKLGALIRGREIDVVAKTYRQNTILLKKVLSAIKASRLLFSVILLRTTYFIVKPFYIRKVWLVSDRATASGDNGEVFFRYLMTRKDVKAKVYFVVGKDDPGYRSLKKAGRTVEYFSFRHRLLTLLADKVISSEATEYVLNPLGISSNYTRDLFGFDFVFLQHGIIRDDISSWLNKYNKNIKLFVTTAIPEYESVINGDYGYDQDIVKLTGLPRLDNLSDKSRKKLIVMPTWRLSLAGELDQTTGQRAYNEGFKQSSYFSFFQSLINDPRISKTLEAHGMLGEFYVHPSLQAQSIDFKGNKYFRVMHMSHDYAKAKSNGGLVVTDYSSVALDFAYLKKPVIYAQFDSDTYYGDSTSSKGYLSYENEGLGEVTYDYETTVTRIVETIESGCKMESKYQDRTEGFFKYFDRNNSKRVYEAILEMDGEDEAVNKVVKPNKIIFYLEKRKARREKPVKLYWWRKKDANGKWNFGDEITRYIIKSIWGLNCVRADIHEAEMAGAGSIIELLQSAKRSKSVKVWGSGFIQRGEKNKSRWLDFYAVRGPISLKRISPARRIALGDPGLLVNLVFEKSQVITHKVGVVVHYADNDSPYLEAIRSNPDYKIIDPLQEPNVVAQDITSCEYILSSSLHGLIFADSFSIPNNWMPLSDKVTGGDYKFNDYYKSTGRKLVKVSPKVLGDEIAIQKLRNGYQRVEKLKKIQKDLIKSFPLREKG